MVVAVKLLLVFIAFAVAVPVPMQTAAFGYAVGNVLEQVPAASVQLPIVCHAGPKKPGHFAETAAEIHATC